MKKGCFPQLLVLKPFDLGHICIQLDLVDDLVFSTYILEVTKDLWARRMVWIMVSESVKLD